MSRPATLTTAARAEAAKAVRWLARRNREAAFGLRRSIADAAHLLGNRRLAGRPDPELVGPHFRLWSLVSYPYVIAYDLRPTPPQILRLAHAARDLGPLLADFSDPPDDTEPGWSRAAGQAGPDEPGAFCQAACVLGDALQAAVSLCGGGGFARCGRRTNRHDDHTSGWRWTTERRSGYSSSGARPGLCQSFSFDRR